MKVAVACRGLEVAPYFLQATDFMCYNVDRGIITGSRNLSSADFPAEKYEDLLHLLGADTVIVGFIEYNLANRLCKSGIEVVAGATGSACDVVRAYVSHTLSGVSQPCLAAADGSVSDDLFDEEEDFIRAL